jgi:hypothetical protein
MLWARLAAVGLVLEVHEGMAVCYIEFTAEEVDASSPTGPRRISSAA